MSSRHLAGVDEHEPTGAPEARSRARKSCSLGPF